MKELKFRAWDGKNMFTVDVMALTECEWSCPTHGKRGISLAYQPHIEVMQFTGFNDSQGIDIYEGDVIEFDRDEWGGKDNIQVVSWDSKDGSWCWGGGITSDMCYRKVIGNIYQHPNLINPLK